MRKTEDHEAEARKQSAADVLHQYSLFVMACIGEGVRPSELRLRLMKEISGIPTYSSRDAPAKSPSSDSVLEPTSSGTMNTESA